MGSSPRVRHHVMLDVHFVPEAFFADGAWVVTLVVVHAHVGGQLRRLAESFPTHGASVRLDIRVRLPVFAQIVPGLETHVANVADERAFLRVRE